MSTPPQEQRGRPVVPETRQQLSDRLAIYANPDLTESTLILPTGTLKPHLNDQQLLVVFPPANLVAIAQSTNIFLLKPKLYESLSDICKTHQDKNISRYAIDTLQAEIKDGFVQAGVEHFATILTYMTLLYASVLNNQDDNVQVLLTDSLKSQPVFPVVARPKDHTVLRTDKWINKKINIQAHQQATLVFSNQVAAEFEFTHPRFRNCPNIAELRSRVEFLDDNTVIRNRHGEPFNKERLRYWIKLVETNQNIRGRFIMEEMGTNCDGLRDTLMELFP